MPFAHTRRAFLGSAALSFSHAQRLRTSVSAVDHILLGVSNLDRGIAWTEQLTGIRAKIGGSHPGVGTRNALLSLGARHYLEIIAPDPDQPAFKYRTDIRTLDDPRLFTWASATTDIDSVARNARGAGYAIVGPNDGSRRTPSGKLLRWRTLSISHKLRSGVVDPIPFLIQWSPESMHPSQDSPPGCTLSELRFQHPDPPALLSLFKTLGIDAQVTRAKTAGLIAVINTPKGSVKFT